MWPTRKDLGFVLCPIIIVESKFKFEYFDSLNSYFNWGTGYSCMNDTKNFRAITDPNLGLIFESKHDRQQILMDPLSRCSRGTTRTEVETDNYDHVVLFDHVVRNKL